MEKAKQWAWVGLCFVSAVCTIIMFVDQYIV